MRKKKHVKKVKQINYSEKLKQLKLMDDDFARIVFANKEAGLEILKILGLVNENNEIVQYETQKDMKNLIYRSVEYDIYAITKDSHINVEIENHKDKASPKRARFHMSTLDVHSLQPNETFTDLPKSFVVFICNFDYFNDGLPYYTIKRKIEETGKDFYDESTIIYINGDYKGDDAIGKLIHDLKCTNPKNMYNSVLKRCVSYFKNARGGKKKMCKIWDDIRNEGKEEGKEEGREEIKVAYLKKVMKNLNYTLIEAMSFYEIPMTDYNKYKTLLEV